MAGGIASRVAGLLRRPFRSRQHAIAQLTSQTKPCNGTVGTISTATSTLRAFGQPERLRTASDPIARTSRSITTE